MSVSHLGDCLHIQTDANLMLQMLQSKFGSQDQGSRPKKVILEFRSEIVPVQSLQTENLILPQFQIHPGANDSDIFGDLLGTSTAR